MYCVVTNKNVGELTAVYDLARSHGASFDFWRSMMPRTCISRRPETSPHGVRRSHTSEHRSPKLLSAPYYEAGLRYRAGEGGPVRCPGLIDRMA